jgi:hypothetical protein
MFSRRHQIFVEVIVRTGDGRKRLFRAALDVRRHVFHRRDVFVERQVDRHDQRRRRRRFQVGQVPPRTSPNVDGGWAAVFQHSRPDFLSLFDHRRDYFGLRRTLNL